MDIVIQELHQFILYFTNNKTDNTKVSVLTTNNPQAPTLLVNDYREATFIYSLLV